jgi:glycosyltransferase involved in cell wall biosynthesis
VTVVVTVLNEIATVDDLVRAVTAQLQPDDELVIADGGSADGTAARIEGWARRDGRVRMVSAPGTNISGGRNAAITAARNRVIVCTDAGCRPVDGWLDALRLPFAEESAPDLVTGVPRVVAETPFQWAQALACYPNPDEARRPSWLVRTYGRYLGQVMRADLPFARSLAFTVDAWKDVGGFPEDLGWVEDGAFGRAVARAHRCVIAADAEVGWVQRQSVSSTYRMYFRYGIGHAASGDVMLQCRDLARVAAYGFGLGAVASRDRRWLGAALAGSALYCSLPLARVVRYRQGWVVGALVPPAMALKDIAQAHGSVATHLRHLRRGGVG